MAWFDDLPEIKAPHDACNGTGEVNGESCPGCNGTGLADLRLCQPDQTEFYVKYTLVKLLEMETTLGDTQDKVNDCWDKLEDIWELLNE